MTTLRTGTSTAVVSWLLRTTLLSQHRSHRWKVDQQTTIHVTCNALAVETPRWIVADSEFDILGWCGHLLAQAVMPIAPYDSQNTDDPLIYTTVSNSKPKGAATPCVFGRNSSKRDIRTSHRSKQRLSFAVPNHGLEQADHSFGIVRSMNLISPSFEIVMSCLAIGDSTALYKIGTELTSNFWCDSWLGEFSIVASVGLAGLI